MYATKSRGLGLIRLGAMEKVEELVARTFVELGARDVFNLQETHFLQSA